MAVASIASDAYLFMPWDKVPEERSVWQATELPALTKNPHVNKIYRIDPRTEPEENPGGSCVQTLIWNRATDAELEYGWKCPV